MISSSPQDIRASEPSSRPNRLRANRQSGRANRLANRLANFFWRFAHSDRRASLFLPLSILLFLSLISYDARDQSLNTASDVSLSVENWLGTGGAFVSDLLVQLLGKGSWLFVFVLASFSVKSRRGIFWRNAFLATSLLLASSAYALSSPEATNAWPAGGGGIVGEVVRNAAYSDSRAISLASILAAFFASLSLFFASAPMLPRALYGSLRALFTFGREQLEFSRDTISALSKTAHNKNVYNQAVHDKAMHNNLEHNSSGQNQQPQSADVASEEESPLLLREPIAWNEEDNKGSADNMGGADLMGANLDEGEIPPPSDGDASTNSEESATDSSPDRAADQDYNRATTASSLQLPPLSLLSSAGEEQLQDEQSAAVLQATSELLEKTLSDYGVRGSITDVQCGPVITLYALEPVAGVKASRVISLAEDIARTMRRVSVRIAVIPGKNGIGIELPNPRRQTVVLGELLTAAPRTLFLPLALGASIDGTAQVVDLAEMPHLLIAGTTGAGKSVGINAMILSLLYRHAPETCRLILIDPKMLELSAYQGIPHLLTSVITDHEKALSALRWAALEMERRYRLMAAAGARNIEGYRRKRQHRQRANGGDTLESLPYIVIIIDEMADLMLTSGRSIEMVLQRLAQMARAAGIHMIVATQRPSVDVITGTIKANFPTRISYRVASKFDSRTILNEQGAEMLLGRGDMLFMPVGGRITRIHGPFVGEEEVESVCNFLRSQAPPNYVPEILETKSKTTSNNLSGDDEDPLYAQAIKIVAKHQRASTSFLQRQLQIGYNRAARIIERMEEEGIVGLADGTGKRSVLTQEGDAGGSTRASDS